MAPSKRKRVGSSGAEANKKPRVKPTQASSRPRRGSNDVTVKSQSKEATITKVTPQKRGRGRPPKVSPQVIVTKGKSPKRAAKTASAKKSAVAGDANTVDKSPHENTNEASVTTPSKKVNKSSKKSATVADEDSASFWLMKAEPESRIEKGQDVKFSIDDLKAATAAEPWDGVRNPIARNNMRTMMKGDMAFFYHSNCKVPAIVGLMEVVQEHSVDESAFDPSHPYYDPKSTRDKPRWCVVHVEFRHKFVEPVTLRDLRTFAKPGGALENMSMLKMSRLSVSKVTQAEWDFIMGLVEMEKDEGQVDGIGNEEAPETSPNHKPKMAATVSKEPATVNGKRGGSKAVGGKAANHDGAMNAFVTEVEEQLQ